MTLLLRAIITGFGYKVGAELGRLFTEKVGLKKKEEKPAEADLPDGLPKTPPHNGDDDSSPTPPEDGDGDDGDDVPDADGADRDSAKSDAA